jgi:hypothetical protein
MARIEGPSESRRTSGEGAEYSPVAGSRHAATAHVSGRKLRLAYFALASAWGFLVGVGGVLASLQADGKLSSAPGSGTLVYVALCLVIAVVGGGVIAGAYQEAKRRK